MKPGTRIVLYPRGEGATVVQGDSPEGSRDHTLPPSHSLEGSQKDDVFLTVNQTPIGGVRALMPRRSLPVTSSQEDEHNHLADRSTGIINIIKIHNSVKLNSLDL